MDRRSYDAVVIQHNLIFNDNIITNDKVIGELNFRGFATFTLVVRLFYRDMSFLIFVILDNEFGKDIPIEVKKSILISDFKKETEKIYNMTLIYLRENMVDDNLLFL